MNSGRQQQGFTYLAALFFVGLAGLGLATVAELWSHARQREKEAELIWVGNQFTQAIGLYYQRSPGSIKRFPNKLEDLLEDRRHLNIQRHLRKVYVDPMTGKASWGLVPAPSGGFMGVRSLSNERAIRQAGAARTYSEWTFAYEPPLVQK